MDTNILGPSASAAFFAIRQDKESVYMTNLVSLELLMMESAISIAMTSAL